MNKKLTIITLTYNQLEIATKPYINSLYQNTNKDLFDLIIIDNASCDGTVEYLKQLEQEKDNITIIYNSENLGYSKGNNQGLKLVNTEYTALLNNDILLSPGWEEPLLKKLNEPLTGMVSSNAIQSRFVKQNKFLSCAKEYAEKAKEKYYETVKCDFSCVMFKTSLINSIGYLDENYSPAYFEDDDFCVRTILAGFKNYISSQSNIYHKTSTSGKKMPELEQICKRNEKYFFDKFKNNQFIKYWYIANSENMFLKPRFERLKKYKSSSLRYYFEKIFN